MKGKYIIEINYNLKLKWKEPFKLQPDCSLPFAYGRKELVSENIQLADGRSYYCLRRPTMSIAQLYRNQSAVVTFMNVSIDMELGSDAILNG